MQETKESQGENGEQTSKDAARRDQIEQLTIRLKGWKWSHKLLEEEFSPAESEAGYEFARARFKQSADSKSGKRGTPNNDRFPLPHCVDLYSHVRRVSRTTATLCLGRLFKLLDPDDFARLSRENGVERVSGAVDILAAAKKGGLVVVEDRRTVIWKGREFEMEKSRACWEYFWKIAVAATCGLSIGPEDFSESTNRRHLVDWKSKLAAQQGFPRELWEQITVDQGRHRLRVPAEKITLFRKQSTGSVI